MSIFPVLYTQKSRNAFYYALSVLFNMHGSFQIRELYTSSYSSLCIHIVCVDLLNMTA